jgi:DNA-directed RNA polymerase specialized sigma54-like protein
VHLIDIYIIIWYAFVWLPAMAQELQRTPVQKQQQAKTRELIEAIVLLENSEPEVEQIILQKPEENLLVLTKPSTSGGGPG